MFKILIHMHEILPVYIREEDAKTTFTPGVYAKPIFGTNSFHVLSPEFEVQGLRVQLQERSKKDPHFEPSTKVCFPKHIKKHFDVEDHWHQQRVLVCDINDKVLFAITITRGLKGVDIQTPLEFYEDYYIGESFGIKVEDSLDTVSIHIIFN